MNKLFFSILVCLSVLACEQGNTDDSPQKTNVSEAEAKLVVDKWLMLWETYDSDMLGDIFLQSEDLTYFSSEKEGLMQGFEELLPHHTGFGFVAGGKKPELSLWLENVETRVYDGSVMVGGVWYFGDKSQPIDSISNGPVTFVLVKNSEGITKIAHTHFANY